MIPSREDVQRSLRGAWLLFLDRPEGMRFFDLSLEGFWRSFGAIWLVLPAYAASELVERGVRLAEAPLPDGVVDQRFILTRALGLVADWLAMPILLALAARPLGIASTYVPYIVARNWASVIAIVPYGVLGLGFAAGLVTIETAQFAAIIILAVVLRYQFLVARYALKIGVGLAVGLVIADVALSLVLGEGIDRLWGLWGASSE